MAGAKRSPETETMLDRIEQRVAGRSVREQPMFGVVAVMVDDAMLVAVGKDGGLLVRVDAADDDLLLERPEASRAEMGNGRSMGPGWLWVEPDAVIDDDILEFWLAQCLRRLDSP